MYKLPLTTAANVSIWAVDANVATPVHTSVSVAFNNLGVMNTWHQDGGAAGDRHGGISIASNYFGNGIAGLPTIGGGGLDLYIFVQAKDAVTKVSNNAFNLLVWVGSASTPPAGVPIFLQGRGRNFRVDLYERHGSFDAKEAVNVMSEFFQNSNRGTFNLQDPALSPSPTNENYLEITGGWAAQVQRAVPGAIVTMTDSLHDPDTTALNMLADNWDVESVLSNITLDSSIPVPATLNSFCAYPWALGDQGSDVAGGFSTN